MAAAQLRQLLRRQPSAAEIVGGHAGHRCAEITVDGDERQALRNVQLGAVGQRDDAVHPVLAHQLDVFLLPVVFKFREAEQHFIILFVQRQIDMMGEQRKKRRDGVWHDERHCIGMAAFQSLGAGVDLIVQLADGLLHLLAVDVPHRQPVDHLGNRSQRDPGLPCHIGHGGGFLFVHDIFTSFGFLCCPYHTMVS